MIKSARKNQVTEYLKNDIVEEWAEMEYLAVDLVDGLPAHVIVLAQVDIKWIPSNRKYSRQGFCAFMIDGQIEGEIMFCSDCGESFIEIPGNVIDDLENCWTCGSKSYQN